eukprot:CAMPEP_0176297772 /NCGR_PEP_ID=MMETSP0121_2-20121125/58898_1 /TAXON_ID=160619 /ORGANISM="Kryptoperidinium foliaceum, Strain CCMP 1326" /LENGTH=51 /DNA_ID=CAMNT_0017638979 /DNA_START=154 /DNA_END=305 /DNA_ORIENTATION=-
MNSVMMDAHMHACGLDGADARARGGAGSPLEGIGPPKGAATSEGGSGPNVP